MRWRWVLVGVVAGGASLYWLGHDPRQPATLADAEDAGRVSTASVSAAAEKAADPSFPRPLLARTEGPATNAEAADDSWPLIARLLERPGDFRRGSMVPRLSAETEERVIARCNSIPEITNKYHVLQMLAFGGGDRAAEVLRKVLTDDYAGRRVSRQSTVLLCCVPELCGVLARRSDKALTFLREGAMSEFWVGRSLWRDPEGREEWRGFVQGACIRGLALSGRDKDPGLMEWYRTHPEEVGVFGPEGGFQGTVNGAVVTAVFYHSLIQELGAQDGIDEIVSASGEDLMRRFVRWSQSADGQSWRQWSLHAQFVARQRKSPPTTPTP